MNRHFVLDNESFEFDQREFESGEFDFASEYETPPASSCPPFTPVAIERPGGERVKDKRIPNSADIVVIQGAYGKTPLHRLTAAALKALVCAARADGIKHPRLLPTGARSGFRDPKLQKAAWERALKRYGSAKEANKWVAKPGFSAHQSGRAIDFYLGLTNDSRNVAKLRLTPAYKWMQKNARRFGFYPYPDEPWHWEYNPPAAPQSEFSFENGGAFEFETGKPCARRDWCAPNYIEWLQKSLNRLIRSGTPLKENGVLDRTTRRAIIAFQRQNNLKPDGAVGSLTEKALVAKGASQPPAVRNLSCLPAKTDALVAKLNKYRGGIPLHILLGWIEVESGRQIGSITSLCERGYFQIHPDEAIDYKIPNHHLLSYDEDHSIQSGIKIVNNYVARTNSYVKNFGLPASGEAFWKIVEMHHWIPSGPRTILTAMKKHGVKPSSWSAIAGFALSPVNRAQLKKVIGFDPKQGIDNADKMIDKANAWLKKLQSGAAPTKETGSVFSEESWEAFSGDGELEFEQPKVSAVAAAPPALAKTEKAAQGETLYVKIPIGLGKNLALTGIFIPRSFNPNSDVELVVYLHGHKGLYPGNSVLIDGYWNGARFPFFALREEAAASGKNVIFVAPSLGAYSEAGSLTRKGGFDAYLEQVSAAINEHFMMPRFKRRLPEFRSIILAAHSGGGSPMLSIVRGKDRDAAKVKECWCYDSMYGAVASYWVNWAKANPGKNLYVYYGPAKGWFDPKTGKRRVLPRDNAETIACEKIRLGLSNICVEPSRAKSTPKASAHFWVPQVHLQENLLHRACSPVNVCPKRPALKKKEI